MRLTLGTSLVKSALTGANLGRFYIYAESKEYCYFANYQEGSAIKAISMPLSDSTSVARLVHRIEVIACKYQDKLDAIMLAPDYPLFKEGRPAPIAASLYWDTRKAIEFEEI